MSEENETPSEDNLKELRANAKAGKDAIDENTALKRRMAFMEAGIPLSGKPAQALLQNYAGELTTEAIKAEAIEWGLVGTEDGGASTPPPAYGEGTPEYQQQQMREQASGNPAPTEKLVKDGHEAAFDDFLTNRENGMSMRDATTVAFGDVIRAGVEGKPGARFDPADWAAQQDAAGHGAQFAR